MTDNNAPKDLYYNPKEFRRGWRAIDTPESLRRLQKKEAERKAEPRVASWKIAAGFFLAGSATTFFLMMMLLAVKPELLQLPYALSVSLAEHIASLVSKFKLFLGS